MQLVKTFMSTTFLPSGSSKRVSSSTRCRVGSLVPQISLSVMMTWESSVSHSPGPSCEHKDFCYFFLFCSWLTIDKIMKTIINAAGTAHSTTAELRLYSYHCSGADGGSGQTSFDCRMLRRGIHTVPTMVSQIKPLFHTSTVRPKSRRFISLKR